jgi:hypothetical protein
MTALDTYQICVILLIAFNFTQGDKVPKFIFIKSHVREGMEHLKRTHKISEDITLAAVTSSILIVSLFCWQKLILPRILL